MDDDELIYKMLKAFFWEGKYFDKSHRKYMRAALVVARNAILDEAISACANERLTHPQEEADKAYNAGVDECLEVIRAIRNQEQPQ